MFLNKKAQTVCIVEVLKNPDTEKNYRLSKEVGIFEILFVAVSEFGGITKS